MFQARTSSLSWNGLLQVFTASRRSHQGWAESPRRRLLIHAGLHKTGTTALQQYLSGAYESLRSDGVLYPASGRQLTPGGHHNIAWQLSGDRRFNPDGGDLDDLAAEIAAFPGDAILSSEDFESSLSTPEEFLPLLRHPLLKDHETTILMSVRDQVSYFESLVFEMLDHGLAEDVERLCRIVLETGQVRYAGWVFHFDYARLQTRLADLPATIVIRPYGNSSIHDFVGFTGLTLSEASEPRAPVNPRKSLPQALSKFCSMRLGEEGFARFADEFMSYTHLDGVKAELSPRFRTAFIQRFAAGNRRVSSAQGFAHELLPVARPLSEDSLAMEVLFSTRAMHSITDTIEREARHHASETSAVLPFLE